MIREGIYGVGQESEQICARYFSNKGYVVIPISEYTNNTGGMINAPMIVSSYGPMVSPDLMVMKGSKLFWIEVKMKNEPTYYWKRHRWEHGIDTPNFNSYKSIQLESGWPVYIFVHEIHSPKTAELYLYSRMCSDDFRKMKSDLIPSNNWLYIALDDANRLGESRPNNIEMISKANPRGFGTYWPRAAMKTIDVAR